jgi:hypothetical protein
VPRETELASLILRRANNSRLSGRWSDDDYDVLENGVVVGRTFKVPVPPQDRPWMWASGHNGEIRRAAADITSRRAKPHGCVLRAGARLRGRPGRSRDTSVFGARRKAHAVPQQVIARSLHGRGNLAAAERQ